MGVTDPKAAAVCCRQNEAGQIEVLLVRSRDGERWTFPKGSIERWDRAPYRSAEREAWEEAGVKGQIDPLPLGRYRHAARSRKMWRRVDQDVEAYLLRVTDTSGRPELGREPSWFAPAAAETVLVLTAPTRESGAGLSAVLRTALDRMVPPPAPATPLT